MASQHPLSGIDPPLAYTVAVWLGLSHEEVVDGLQGGWIVPPPGAPRDWSPTLPGEGADAGNGTALEARFSPSDIGPRRARRPDGPPFLDRPADIPSREQLHGLLSTLDPGLSDATFDAVWGEAGRDDAERAGSLMGFLRRATSAAQAPTLAGYSGGGDYEALRMFFATPGHQARFVRLSGQTGAAIAELAQQDVGARQSLARMEPWALTGNRTLVGATDPEGLYDRFDPNSGEPNLSDAWIGDRARFLAWRTAKERGHDLASGSPAGWRFVDRNLDSAATVEIGGTTEGPVHQVIFAKQAGGDMVTGGKTTDRIYGGSGDDVLRGASGDDLLEGGRGSDLLIGGSGRDWLVGGAGEDELDGGIGGDILQGGAGADTLTGGRGDDRLEGGRGADTYRFDIGDGADTVIDVDGDGTVVIDDTEIAGTMSRHDANWTSADGAFTFRLDGDPGAGGVLTIERSASAGNAEAGNVVRIEHWQQGKYGITLQQDDAVGEESTPLPATDGKETGTELVPSVAPGGDLADAGDALADTVAVADADANAQTAAADDVVDTVASGDFDSTAWSAGVGFGPLAGIAETATALSADDFAAAVGAWDGPAPPDVPALAVSSSGHEFGPALGYAEIAAELADAGTAADDVAALSTDWNTAMRHPATPTWPDVFATFQPPDITRHRTA